MCSETFCRNEMFWGEENQKLLASKSVAVFGLGGVGGYCAEALVRAGVGNLTVVDFDKVSESNINRQIIALHSSVGKKKTELFESRLKDINPNLNLDIVDDFYNDEELILAFSDKKYDFAADAIDTMRSKIHLLESCYTNNIPVVSSMGAGNRMDPTQLYICDLKDVENRNAPFVSNVIYQLKKLGITEGITFVASREKPFVQEKIIENERVRTKSGLDIEFNKITPASTPFVASVAGIFMASYIVKSFLKDYR
ncbi:MAG: tRNA threonylcarbamoyladenosine dehydratase [Muribaculaceae bacterium]|nr:tRNA threonylcarbamoyladenosine dehydratase [Muribaculaceae bacterium]